MTTAQAEKLTPDLAAGSGRARLASLDIIRGAVMVLMAVDHVRVYFSNATFDPTDLSQTSAGLFLTRWVTHFCAPLFVFLAGTGAFLRGDRDGDRRALSRFLLTRGAWLVLIEMTVVRWGWTFNFDYAHYLLAGVIWMLGCCMIMMAGLVWLSPRVVGLVGLVIVFGHNILDYVLPGVMPGIKDASWLWVLKLSYLGGWIQMGADGPGLAVLYVFVPWIGVMAAGYGFGLVMRLDPERRRRACLQIGGGAVGLFLLLRGFNLYGNAKPWTAESSPLFTVLSFINTRKYPASLLFLLMTIGPAILLIPRLESARGKAARVLVTFGRVPFLYYVLHIPLIHFTAVLFSLARYGEAIPWLFQNHPMAADNPPAGYGYGVGMIWLVTAVVVTILYLPCRWFAELRARRRDPWLSFL